mgnify:CR=1 FL=1
MTQALWQLFSVFLQIGAFSIGGGYAVIPMIRDQVVIHQGWITQKVFTDIITISQMTPGPIAINSATFVGLKIAGFSGALCATFGCILPSCIIVSVIAWIYMKYRKMTLLQGVLNSLRPAVVSLIGAAGLSIIITAFFGEQGVMALQNLKVQAVVIFAVSVYLLRWRHMNPITVMLLAGVMQVGIGLVK